MIPASLRGRLVASFVALALVLLVAVGGTLFFVLRGLHADAASGSLADIAGSVVPQVRQSVGSGNLRGTIEDVQAELATRDLRVWLVGTDGRLRPIGGAPIGSPVMSTDGTPGETVRGTVEIDGQRFAYAATVLRRTAAGAPRAIAFLAPDRSSAQAVADLGRAIPAVALAIIVVAAPLAWLIARSVTGPLQQVAAAAAELPTGGEPTAIALTGPSDVRVLTETFNAMAAALDLARRREVDLLADLQHDLRTPLTVISGFAAALADGTASGEEIGRAAGAIAEESARLEQLLGALGVGDGLRAGDTLRTEQLEAASLLEHARERFLPRAASAGVDLVVLDDPAWQRSFAGDRQAVERILANLVSNALDMTPAGGHVWLAAEPVAPASLALTVMDDGPGFPPGAAGRVFERFYRGDASRSGSGMGLGLAIVRELAEAHGGSATAENVAPHGARVVVILPIVPRPR